MIDAFNRRGLATLTTQITHQFSLWRQSTLGKEYKDSLKPSFKRKPRSQTFNQVSSLIKCLQSVFSQSIGRLLTGKLFLYTQGGLLWFTLLTSGLRDIGTYLFQSSMGISMKLRKAMASQAEKRKNKKYELKGIRRLQDGSDRKKGPTDRRKTTDRDYLSNYRFEDFDC